MRAVKAMSFPSLDQSGFVQYESPVMRWSQSPPPCAELM